MTTCNHSEPITTSTKPFTAPVYHPILGTENRAAHGCVTLRTECTACGARRLENHNGNHVELGEWRGSRAQREERLSLATLARVAALRAIPAPLSVRKGTMVVNVCIEPDGFIHVCSDTQLSERDSQILMSVLPCGFVDAARLLRSTCLDEAAAREDARGA